MRVGVIRGDLPGPVFLSDVEQTSQTNFSVEPAGQSRYLSRPTVASVTTALSAVPAAIESTSNITFPLTVAGAGANVLKLRTLSTGGYTTVTVAAATYTTMALLLVAVNAALVTAGIAITAEQGATNVRLRLKTSASFGIGASIGSDSNGNGSTLNAPLGFAVGGASNTLPAAAALIAATLPVGGPLDVSAATLATQVAAGLSTAQVKAIADSIAPQFVESDTVLKSYQIGVLGDFRNPAYTPDVNRLPVIATSAAITIVQDDGVSLFSAASTAAQPTITGAVNGGGNLTITGSGLGNSEFPSGTKVKVTNPATNATYTVEQRKFTSAAVGGTISSTSIVIPQSALGGVVAGWKVQVLYTSLASNVFTST
jgi:hypothetical protein